MKDTKKIIENHLKSIASEKIKCRIAIILNNKREREEHFIKMDTRTFAIKNNITVDTFSNKDYFVLQHIFNPYSNLSLKEAKELIIDRLNNIYSHILIEKQKAYYFEELFNLVKETKIKVLEI